MLRMEAAAMPTLTANLKVVGPTIWGEDVRWRRAADGPERKPAAHETLQTSSTTDLIGNMCVLNI